MGASVLWGYAVQALLALSWTLYALLLPPLLRQAGLDAPTVAAWLALLLIADQLVFAAADCASGLWAARLARNARPLASPIAVAAIVSSTALAGLPWLAQTGSVAALLAATLVWALGGSLLRAPLLSVLGRAVATDTRTRRVAAVTIGLAVAGACAPWLTSQLAGADARLPLGLAGAALALAALYVGRVEAQLPPARDNGRLPRDAAALRLLAGASLAAVAAQLQTALAAKAQYAASGAGPDWLALFWLGCALGGLIAPACARRLPERPVVALALAAGGLCLLGALTAPSLPALAGAQALAGLLWGIALSSLFASAAVRGAGSLGLLFAALALAVVVRLALQRAGLDAATAGGLAAGGWLLAALLLARRRAD